MVMYKIDRKGGGGAGGGSKNRILDKPQGRNINMQHKKQS